MCLKIVGGNPTNEWFSVVGFFVTPPLPKTIIGPAPGFLEDHCPFKKKKPYAGSMFGRAPEEKMAHLPNHAMRQINFRGKPEASLPLVLHRAQAVRDHRGGPEALWSVSDLTCDRCDRLGMRPWNSYKPSNWWFPSRRPWAHSHIPY